MAMNIDLFIQMLQIDSTTGSEAALSQFLDDRLITPACTLRRYAVEAMSAECRPDHSCPENLFFVWGEPKLVFCSHLDTVPPYIPPKMIYDHQSGDLIRIEGRGTCDAKGQIFAMYEACLELEKRGYTDFGLLLLAGEETGSYGAKTFSVNLPEGMSSSPVVIVGEPTDNMMASAAKGTKAFELTFTGSPCHSGYPQYGVSAIEMFHDFMNALRSIRFPYDELLGETTWNIGRLVSDNPQNILSEKLTCRLYFRTTFESDEMVVKIMKNIFGPEARLRFGRPKVQDGSDVVAKDVAPWQLAMNVVPLGGDLPLKYTVLEGFDCKPVAFGSDAPHLTCFRDRILCGPGSILTAHRPEEYIDIADLEQAKQNYIRMYETLRPTIEKRY